MNQGGEPGHDDYGLPRVDIEIPDDARELDRDVQAYYRELRALARQQRSRRWRLPVQRSGMLMPLVAGCLLVAMLSGMVLTMFSANSYISGLTDQQARQGDVTSRGAATGPGSPASGRSIPSQTTPAAGATSSPQAGGSAPPGLRPGPLLPDQTISVAGRQVALRTITTAALAIIPAGCRCLVALRKLSAQARQANVPVYLVGSPGSESAIARLARTTGLRSTIVATDTDNVLSATYRPVGATVLLVNYRGAVIVSARLVPGLNLASPLADLTGPRP